MRSAAAPARGWPPGRTSEDVPCASRTIRQPEPASSAASIVPAGRQLDLTRRRRRRECLVPATSRSWLSDDAPGCRLVFPSPPHLGCPPACFSTVANPILPDAEFDRTGATLPRRTSTVHDHRGKHSNERGDHQAIASATPWCQVFILGTSAMGSFVAPYATCHARSSASLLSAQSLCATIPRPLL